MFKCNQGVKINVFQLVFRYTYVTNDHLKGACMKIILVIIATRD